MDEVKVNAIFIRSNTKRTLRNDEEQIPDVKRTRLHDTTKEIGGSRLTPSDKFDLNKHSFRRHGQKEPHRRS